MNSGGLAQMTYNNNFSSENSLGIPGTGFASRGKGNNIKRLSFAPPAQINSIYEDVADSNSVPKSSRSQLLAGLRTAPKHQAVPASAPYNQSQFRFPADNSYQGRNGGRQDIPQTAVSATFPSHAYANHAYGNGQLNYSLPEQVLAPADFTEGNSEHMDPQLYNELMATNMYLVQRQQQLQQQLRNVTAAAQQLQGLNLNGNPQYPSSPLSPQLSTYNQQYQPQMTTYNQQVQNGVQPIVQPVVNQPGLYTVYNPLTGQSSYIVDQSVQNQLSASPPYTGSSTDSETANYYRKGAMSPAAVPVQSVSPPKKTPSPPQNVTLLPPPSATAFRPGHRKAASIGFPAAGGRSVSDQALKSPNPRASAFSQTPTVGTFGPGMGRAGEHATRQPRGPPPLEELVAAPTTKHEGSKNFAARQRRRALNSLVRAGNERRTGRGTGGSGTPCSEGEINFTITPDADLENNANNFYSLASGLRGSASGAIGSEWKELKERSRDRGMPARHLAGSSYGGNEGPFGGR